MIVVTHLCNNEKTYIIMFLCDPGFAWEVDGVRLNATESYFVLVKFGVLRQIE